MGMDLFEMEQMLTELESANEKVAVTVNDLNNAYFGDASPKKSFLKCYYDMARAKSYIVSDYVLQMDSIIKGLKENVNNEIEKN